MFGRKESQRGNARGEGQGKGNRQKRKRGKGKPKSKYRLCCHNALCPAATPPLALSFDLPDVFVDAEAEAESEAIKMR